MLDRETIDTFFNYLNTRDLNQMEHLLTENAEFYFPKTQPLIGKKRILKFFSILFKQYPELSFQIKKTIIHGNSAAVHWTNQGVNRKKEPYENEGVTLLEAEAGKIRFISDFFKNTEKF